MGAEGGAGLLQLLQIYKGYLLDFVDVVDRFGLSRVP